MATMIWPNMASILSDWCWLGVRLWDWADIMGARMGHVEGREERNGASEYNDLSGWYIN